MIVVAFAISLSFTLSSQSAFAASITLDNPSFEDPALADGDFTNGVLPGWDGIGSDGKTLISGQTGVFNPSPTFYGTPNYTLESIIPDGDNVAYSNGGYFCQDLPDTLQLNTLYTLQVDVGQRNDAALAGYEIHFRAFDNISQLPSLAGVDSTGVNFPVPPLPGPNSFVTNTVTFETGDSHARAGQLLRICVIVDGTQTNFDNVRLDATPVNDIGKSVENGPPNSLVVGGELIPLDSTSLLVAGSQTNAAWMIPVIVSAIGIGIVIARKF